MDTFTEHFRPWAYHIGVASHRGDPLARSLTEGFITNMGRPNAAREARLLSDLSLWLGERVISDIRREA